MAPVENVIPRDVTALGIKARPRDARSHLCHNPCVVLCLSVRISPAHMSLENLRTGYLRIRRSQGQGLFEMFCGVTMVSQLIQRQGKIVMGFRELSIGGYGFHEMFFGHIPVLLLEMVNPFIIFFCTLRPD